MMNRKMNLGRRLAVAGIAGGMTLGLFAPNFSLAVRADEKETKRIITIVQKREAAEEAKPAADAKPAHWIGVQLDLGPDVLKAQLKLEDAFVIAHVFPNSPAAKAGLQQHDIVVRIGDKPMKQLQDVVDAVRTAGDSEIKVVVLREAKEQAITVKPEKMPDDVVARVATVEGVDVNLDGAADHMKQLEVVLRQLNVGKDTPGLMLLHPPVAYSPQIVKATEDWPKDLSVNVNKNGAQPAAITVKSGDKKWETTEDKLDELPEEIRKHVQVFLTKNQFNQNYQWILKKRDMALNAAAPAEGNVSEPKQVIVQGGANIAEGKYGPIQVRIGKVEGAHGPAVVAERVQAHVIAASGNSDKKLDLILEKLEKLSKEVDELRKK